MGSFPPKFQRVERRDIHTQSLVQMRLFYNKIQIHRVYQYPRRKLFGNTCSWLVLPISQHVRTLKNMFANNALLDSFLVVPEHKSDIAIAQRYKEGLLPYRRPCKQKLLHRRTFTQISFYVEDFLHTDAFTHRRAFLHRSFGA